MNFCLREFITTIPGIYIFKGGRVLGVSLFECAPFFNQRKREGLNTFIQITVHSKICVYHSFTNKKKNIYIYLLSILPSSIKS